MEGVLKNLLNTAQPQTSDKEQPRRHREILEDIAAVARQLDAVQQRYDLVKDEDLIDSLIYQELSLKARHSYLLRLAREENVRYQGNFISE